MRLRLLLPLLLAPALAAPAAAQAPREASGPDAADARRAEAWAAYATRVARSLARSDGSRDLALAALLGALAAPAGEGPLDGELPRWREAAAKRGASDVTTQQLLYAAAAVAGEADAATAAAGRWQALEPGNLAPRLLQARDGASALAAAQAADHHRPDPLALQRWATSALARHAPTAAEWAAFGEGPQPADAVHAAAWAATLPPLLAPDYRPVLGACTGRGGPGPRAAACSQLARLLLARPQTVLDERIGLSIASAQATPAELAALDARARGIDWRQEQLAVLAEREDGRDGTLLARLLAQPGIDGEDALARRMLAEARMAQEPPADWRAPWQRRR